MKRILLLACVAGLMMGSAVQAQDSTYWFDIRDIDSLDPVEDVYSPISPFTQGQEVGDTAVNSGKEGAGVVLRVHPTCANGYEDDTTAVGAFTRYPNFDGDRDLSTGVLWLYADVSDAGDCTTDVISSIGLDFDLRLAAGDPPAAERNALGSIDYEWETAPWSEGNAGAFDGNVLAGDPPDWLGAKAVKVPVVAGPSYAAGTGVVPNVYGSPWKIGKLSVVGGPRAGSGPGHLGKSTYAVHLTVNSLLITRVCNGDSHYPEMVAFGYDAAGNAETPLIDGSQNGATSTLPDALIQVVMKHDGNGDGVTNSQDISAAAPYDFLGKLPATSDLDQRNTYAHDGSNDTIINAQDITSFSNMLLGGSAGC